ncbi:MAG: hypothetical protein CMA06_03305 [Euryarchaeota archaeon]|nr:hypothetical protein [Euryarchaeota archaeon]
MAGLDDEGLQAALRGARESAEALQQDVPLGPARRAQQSMRERQAVAPPPEAAPTVVDNGEYERRRAEQQAILEQQREAQRAAREERETQRRAAEEKRRKREAQEQAREEEKRRAKRQQIQEDAQRREAERLAAEQERQRVQREKQAAQQAAAEAAQARQREAEAAEADARREAARVLQQSQAPQRPPTARPRAPAPACPRQQDAPCNDLLEQLQALKIGTVQFKPETKSLGPECKSAPFALYMNLKDFVEDEQFKKGDVLCAPQMNLEDSALDATVKTALTGLPPIRKWEAHLEAWKDTPSGNAILAEFEALRDNEWQTHMWEEMMDSQLKPGSSENLFVPLNAGASGRYNVVLQFSPAFLAVLERRDKDDPLYKKAKRSIPFVFRNRAFFGVEPSEVIFRVAKCMARRTPEGPRCKFESSLSSRRAILQVTHNLLAALQGVGPPVFAMFFAEVENASNMVVNPKLDAETRIPVDGRRKLSITVSRKGAPTLEVLLQPAATLGSKEDLGLRLTKLCMATAYVGFVHYDLKPPNVLQFDATTTPSWRIIDLDDDFFVFHRDCDMAYHVRVLFNLLLLGNTVRSIGPLSDDKCSILRVITCVLMDVWIKMVRALDEGQQSSALGFGPETTATAGFAWLLTIPAPDESWYVERRETGVAEDVWTAIVEHGWQWPSAQIDPWMQRIEARAAANRLTDDQAILRAHLRRIDALNTAAVRFQHMILYYTGNHFYGTYQPKQANRLFNVYTQVQKMVREDNVPSGHMMRFLEGKLPTLPDLSGRARFFGSIAGQPLPAWDASLRRLVSQTTSPEPLIPQLLKWVCFGGTKRRRESLPAEWEPYFFQAMDPAAPPAAGTALENPGWPR